MQQSEIAQQIAILESQIKKVMTKEALSRYGTLKTAHPQKSMQALVYLAQQINAGKVTTVDDAQLKSVLFQLQDSRKTQIRFA